jgi:integrase/recombinase XerD
VVFPVQEEVPLKETNIIALKPQAVALFISPPTESLSKSTLKAYEADRIAYVKFCDERGVSLGDASSLESYRDFLLGQSCRASTVKRKLSAIKAEIIGCLTATYGKERAELLKPVYKSVKGVKTSKDEKVVRFESILSESEIESLIQAADAKSASIIHFLSKTGCRISTAHPPCSVIGKGMKARTVFISKTDYRTITEAFKGKKYLFETIHHHPYDRVNITKKIGKLSEAILGKHIGAHTLRHSFATNKIQSTRKIQAVSEYLGHSSVSITLDLYVHESPTLSELL